MRLLGASRVSLATFTTIAIALYGVSPASAGSIGPAERDGAFTLVFLPDTQIAVQNKPELFFAQVRRQRVAPPVATPPRRWHIQFIEFVVRRWRQWSGMSVSRHG